MGKSSQKQERKQTSIPRDLPCFCNICPCVVSLNDSHQKQSSWNNLIYEEKGPAISSLKSGDQFAQLDFEMQDQVLKILIWYFWQWWVVSSRKYSIDFTYYVIYKIKLVSIISGQWTVFLLILDHCFPRFEDDKRFCFINWKNIIILKNDLASGKVLALDEFCTDEF